MAENSSNFVRDINLQGLLWWLSGKESARNAGAAGGWV